MNPALWKKGISDAWVQLVVSMAALVLFAVVFIWLMSLVQVGAMAAFLNLLPKFVEEMVGVPLAELATSTGRMSVLFVHVVTLLTCIGWAVGRGSDTVSGEINRGTMDLLLALPIRRASLIGVSAVVTGIGSLALGFSVWVGCWLGVRIVTLPGPIELARLLPGVWNLAAMTFCLGGLTTLLSALDHNRWRTIFLAGGLFVVSSIVKLVAKMWAPGAWLRYLSFLTAYEPQRLSLLPPDVTRPLNWWYDLTLVATGVIAYAAAATVFSYRDIPAPR